MECLESLNMKSITRRGRDVPAESSSRAIFGSCTAYGIMSRTIACDPYELDYPCQLNPLPLMLRFDFSKLPECLKQLELIFCSYNMLIFLLGGEANLNKILPSLLQYEHGQERCRSGWRTGRHTPHIFTCTFGATLNHFVSNWRRRPHCTERSEWEKP